MRIETREAGVPPELPPLTLALEPGVVHVLPVEGDERPKLLSLLLGGRLRPTTGSVLVDGAVDPRDLRWSVALVDTPFASEPSPGIPLRVAVAEELAYGGRPSGRRHVARVLDRHGLGDAAREPVGLLGAADRIRLLVDLAASRPDVHALVLTSPERHGGDPAEWYPALAAVAERGITVAVVTDRPTASALHFRGALDARSLQESA